MKPKVYQFVVALFAAFGSFLYGYDLGVIASVVASDSFVNKFLTHNGSVISGTVVSLFTAGKPQTSTPNVLAINPVQVRSLEP